MIAEQKRGRRPHLAGGGSEVASFARAAAELLNGQRTWHPDLATFKGWDEVQEYVQRDSEGADLAMLVRLVDEFGTDALIGALGNMPSEANADVTISTAHKSKGREWSSVLLASDFQKTVFDSTGEPLPPLPPTVDELRLLYVAVTRARHALDDTNVIELLDA
jgi:superfamily I DNA/RNA helicase